MTPSVTAICAMLFSGAVASASRLSGWFVPATEKVYPDTPPAAARHSGRIFAALGEYEAIQVALRSDTDLENLSVAVVPRVRDGGIFLRPRNVQLFEALYVPTPADQVHPVTPDPLVPLNRHNGRVQISLKAGETKAVWVRVKVPENAKAGTYEFDVLADVSAAKGLERSALRPAWRGRLCVTVWPFRLPAKSRVRTAFGISGECIALHHGVALGSPEYHDLYRKYYEELLDHRICAYSPPYGIEDKRAEKYLRSERVNAFMVPYSEADGELANIWHRLREIGVAHKAWVYPIDEPVSAEAYATLKQRAAFVHQVAPGLKVCSPFFRGPDWNEKLTPFDELVGVLDIWCANTGYYAGGNLKDLMAARQRAGEEAWWYVCCGPGSPFCNFFVNMSALQHRILMWQMYRYGITGLLYWNTTWWGPSSTADPYQDIATVKDINPNIYGDGSLFYPGAKVGIDGPVTSVRLECIRDGLEDYEMLVLAERALGNERVAGVVAQVTQDMVHYLTDAAKFEEIRRRLGERLAALKSPGTGRQ
ncbi:MAG: DUF4091 domain-containing protein [Armatimonadetes bacterium]|nr:DUF4091 domain-containing protein [Armatimonadota bacterium]